MRAHPVYECCNCLDHYVITPSAVMAACPTCGGTLWRLLVGKLPNGTDGAP